MMSINRLTTSLTALDNLETTDVLCCLVTEDERPLTGASGFIDWRLNGSLSKILKAGFFTGIAGEQLLVPITGQLPAMKLFAMGLGRQSSMTLRRIEQILSQASEMLEKALVKSAVIALPALPHVIQTMPEELIQSAFFKRFSGKVAVFSS